MASQNRSKIARVGLLSEVRSLDPRASYDVESTFVMRQIVESPFTNVYGTTDVESALFRGPLRPRIAGGNVFEAEVRDDVVFSDGTSLTVDEVCRMLQESAQIRNQAEVTVERNRLVFRLTRPNSRFEFVLSHLQCGVYRGTGTRLIGTGPFQLTPESTSTFIRLVRNPRYREPVALDEVHFKTYPPDRDGGASALLQAIEEGQVDLSLSLGREEIEAARNVRKSILPGVSVGMLFLNHDSPRLRDRNLRAAIAHSIDRLQVARTSYANALAFVATSVTPRPLGPADDNLTFNPAQAKALLGQMNGGKPDKLTMLTVWGPRPYLPYPQRAAQVIADQIASLGIKVEIVAAASPSDYTRRAQAGDHDLTLSGWVADTMDPCDFLECCLSSARVPSAGNGSVSVACNHGHLRSVEMDQALDRFRGDRRVESLEAVVEIIDREVPLIPLMYGSSTCVHGFHLRNVKPTPLWHVPMHRLDLEV